MPIDTMTAEQRLETVIGLGTPDRVPVAPMIYYFAAQYAKITVYELWSNPTKYEYAINKCFNELGPWDVYYPINPINPEAYTFILPMKIKYPGIDLPADEICQVIEEEVISADEYETFATSRIPTEILKYADFLTTLACRVQRQPQGEGMFAKAKIIGKMLRQLPAWRDEFKKWQMRGAAVQHGLCMEAPFDTLSMSRGLIGFSYDLMERPDSIAETSQVLAKGYLRLADLFTKITGVRRMLVFCHRTSNDFISPKQFAQYAFPSLRMIVDGLVKQRITPFLHCDGNGDRNLDLLHELPKGKVVLQFDGRTDIFRAKAIIGNHCCIFGDVPATMLAFGGKEEVTEYCKKLIKEAGKDGGFILAAGCEVAPNARPENLKAMIDSVKQFGYY